MVGGIVVGGIVGGGIVGGGMVGGGRVVVRQRMELGMEQRRIPRQTREFGRRKRCGWRR